MVNFQCLTYTLYSDFLNSIFFYLSWSSVTHSLLMSPCVSGCCTHTANEFEAWWEVDLGRVYPIREVLIYRRTDCMYIYNIRDPFSSQTYTTCINQSFPSIHSRFWKQCRNSAWCVHEQYTHKVVSMGCCFFQSLFILLVLSTSYQMAFFNKAKETPQQQCH